MPKKSTKKKTPKKKTALGKGKKNGISVAAKSAHKKLKGRGKQLKAQLKKALG